VTTWFISDTHIGHKNILKYCPWRQTWADSIETMDERIIDAWNETVHTGDTIYHLGDVAFASKADKPGYLTELRERLNGHIKLVVGNHDLSLPRMLKCGFDADHTFKLWHNGKLIVMRHAPQSFIRVEAMAATILLHGHSHGNHVASYYDADSSKLFDVGIDAIKSIRPVSLDEVITLFHGKSHG
jgi:calcineurin-like phosphoesterase family protein